MKTVDVNAAIAREYKHEGLSLVVIMQNYN